jgi:hypothetical protein
MCVKNKDLTITMSNMTDIPGKGKFSRRNSWYIFLAEEFCTVAVLQEGTMVQRKHVFIKAV